MERIEEWNEHVGINWWRESRVKLNKVIRKYNVWVRYYSDDRVKTAKLLNKIDKHLEMPYSNQDGGSGYREELLEMKRTVESKFTGKI